MEILIILLLLGLIGAAIGQRKGQPIGGFLLGFLLGPIGLVIVVLHNGGTRKCPDCAERVQGEANVCKHCGYRFPPGSAQKPSVIGPLGITVLVIIGVLLVLGLAS